MNSEQGLKLNVRGDLIEIPSYAISHIPFFKILSETKSDDVIKVDAISPKFLNYIMEYIKNQEPISYLKRRLTENFEEKTIKDNLMYLGMDKLLNILYDLTINDMPVIEYFNSNECKMRDGRLIPINNIAFTNTLILLPTNLNPATWVSDSDGMPYRYCIVPKVEMHIPRDLFINVHESWFIKVVDYHKYKLPRYNVFTKPNLN